MNAFDEALWAFRDSLPGKARIYIAGCSGEPLTLAAFLKRNPEWARDVTFFGIWIPGVNTTDWTGFHPTTQSESIFTSPAMQGAFGENRFSFRPLSYVQSTRWLNETPCDGIIALCAHDQRNDSLSLGISADFTSLILERRSIPALAIVNSYMPYTPRSVTLPLDRFMNKVEDDTPLLSVPTRNLPTAFDALGEHIATLIENGDTLQFGLGNVQQAVLKSLTGHRDLRIHSGMVSDPLLSLLDHNAIADHPGAVTTGVAIGTATLYERSASDTRFVFAPVSYTHHIETLAQIPRFHAINSCISIDLFGQVNAEFIGTRQISGTGGLVDFLKGAALSQGGRGIVALLSTAKQGTVSRVVPRLDPNAVSIARQDVDTVVTEHGAAHLRNNTVDERAKALIAIAHPDHRENLERAWRRMRKEMA